MTPDEITDLIKKGPTSRLVAALGPLSEPERKKLAKRVVELRKDCAKSHSERNRAMEVRIQELHGQPVPCQYCGKTLRTPKAKQCFECGKQWHDAQTPAAESWHRWDSESESRMKLAVLGVASWTEAQRFRVWEIGPRWPKSEDCREYVFQVLCDRKPDWLAQWVDKELDQENLVDWQFVRRLIRAQLCPKPQSENYTLKMLLGLHGNDRGLSLKQFLLDDSELLADEVWRIFELSPARETILTAAYDDIAPRGDYPCMSWSRTLIELSQEGKLDRQRLLTASLSSLLRNTAARNTGWFCKFHERLDPTVEERHTLQPSYLQLLSHPVPSVVGMALDALAILHKAVKLDAFAFLDAVGPVFHVQPKAQPLAAVKLLGRATAHKEHAPKLAEVLLSGLAHPAVQVQEAIIELLGKLRDQVADIIAATLPAQLEFVAPSLQERARKLLVDETSAPSVPASLCPTSDLIEQARQIPSPWREMAGIDSLLRACEGTGEISAVAFDPMAVPRLYADQRVQPIGTLDELIERLTVAVEGLDDAIEFELLVDGLSRLCDQRPEDFQARVAPLLLRIEKLAPSNPKESMIISSSGLRMALFTLVLPWCGRAAPRSLGMLGLLDARLGILAERIGKAQAAPLLACPTHRQGWIDPREMAARFEAYQRLEHEPSKLDVIQGLLRLAPDGRAEALARTANLPGTYVPAFRYALGGPLEETSLPTPVLIAAGRARTPFAELTELQALGEPNGPDAALPARYTWHVNHSDADSQVHWARLHIEVTPAIPALEKIRDLPATLLHTWRRKTDFDPEGQTGMNRWKATVWPANLEPYFVLGARIHAGRYSQTSLLRQRSTFLEPLFDPDVPLTEMAQLHLALCLNEQAPEVTGLAVDALVELIRDGRCIGTELGEVLGRMLPCNFIKLNRLGKQLETAARASLMHAHVCGQIVQTACARLTEARKDLHHLLGPLLEWLSALEQGVVEDLRPMLEKLTSGKTGALARKLLALRANPGKRTPLLLEALQGRVERARRWALQLSG